MIPVAKIAADYYLNPEAADAVALISRYTDDLMVPENLVSKFVEDVRAAQGLTHTQQYRHYVITHSQLTDLIKRHEKDVIAFIKGEAIDYEVYEIFYDYFVSAGLMPYNVAKARSDDPQSWICDRLVEHMGEDV